MNTFNSLPRLILLIAAIFFVEPLIALVWSDVHSYSGLLTGFLFLAWLPWDNWRGTKEYFDKC